MSTELSEWMLVVDKRLSGFRDDEEKAKARFLFKHGYSTIKAVVVLLNEREKEDSKPNNQD